MPVHPKTKERVSWKEFFRQWKDGMNRITPLQQCIIIQFGQLISLVGVIWGIVFSVIIGYYWMMVILIGALIVVGTQLLGNWQKKFILKQIDAAMKQADEVQSPFGVLYDKLTEEELKGGENE